MKTKFGAAVLEIKELSEDGTFSGFASIFNYKDSGGDIVLPGAFTKSLARHFERNTRPKLFWQHDMHQPIGSWIEFDEQERGLWGKGRLNMEVQRGREAHALLKAKDIDGLSIGYNTIQDEVDRARSARLLKELDLVEVSVVSLGMNDLALVDDVKAAEIAGLRDRIAAGDRLTARQWEALFKDMGLSNSEAERAVRVHGLRSGQGEPDDTVPVGDDFTSALWAAMRDAPIIDNSGE